MSSSPPPRLIPSYGRRKGKHLREGKKRLLEELLPEVRVDLSTLSPEGAISHSLPLLEGGGQDNLRATPRALESILTPTLPSPFQGEGKEGRPFQGEGKEGRPFQGEGLRIRLEIGFGAGERLAEEAARYPDILFIGCEPYVNGVASLLARIVGASHSLPLKGGGGGGGRDNPHASPHALESILTPTLPSPFQGEGKEGRPFQGEGKEGRPFQGEGKEGRPFQEGRNLTNIRIHDGDARPLLAALPPSCLERAYILFPDPWPKERHHKRRIVNAHTLDLLARVMQPQAELWLATDHAPYAAWMEECLSAHGAFTPLSSSPVPPEGWIPTRYEQKRLAGEPRYMRWKRTP